MRPMWPGESRGDSAGSNCGAPMAIAGEEPGKHGPGAGFAARQRGIPAGIEGGLGALPGRPGPRRLLAISVRVARVNRGSSICCAPERPAQIFFDAAGCPRVPSWSPRPLARSPVPARAL